MIKELKEILKKEAEQTGESFKLDAAKTLAEMGYSFKDAIKKLKDAGVRIILTEDEKEQTFEDLRKAISSSFYEGPFNINEFEDTSDIIMVHKTDYPPKGDKIHSRYSGEVLDNCKITLGGIEYAFASKSGRDTVHLSANHEVSANNGGSWDKKRYAVILPFDDLQRFSKIENSVTVDTYTRGPVNLTENGYILCPKGESRDIQLDNPNVTVIEYEGEYVKEYANMLIAQLGYKLELAHEHGFLDGKQDKRYYDIMKQQGFTSVTHAHSVDKHRENVLGMAYKISAIIKLIKDEKILEKVDREQLIEELNSYDFAKMVKNILINESRKGKDRQIEKYREDGYTEDMIHALVRDSGENYDEIFIEELKKIGIDISAEGLQQAIEENTDNEDIIPSLKIPMESIITGYVLDSISLRSKEEGRINSSDIAKISKKLEITSKHIGDAKGVVEEPLKENVVNQKGE